MGPSGTGPGTLMGSDAGLGSPGGRVRVDGRTRRSGNVDEMVGVSIMVLVSRYFTPSRGEIRNLAEPREEGLRRGSEWVGGYGESHRTTRPGGNNDGFVPLSSSSCAGAGAICSAVVAILAGAAEGVEASASFVGLGPCDVEVPFK